MLAFGAILASVRKSIYDNFNRPNSSGLGTSTDGTQWTTVTSGLDVVSNKAAASAATYPISASKMPVQNNQVDLYGVGQGAAAALWVTDSGNWWAAGIESHAVDCNCYNYYNSYYYTYVCGNNSTCSGYTFVCVNYNTAFCKAYASSCNGYSCKGYNAYNSKNKSGGNCIGYNCNGYFTYCTDLVPANCSYGYTYCSSANAGNPNYCGATGYSGPYTACYTCYPQYIRIIQSVASTVSTILNQVVTSITDTALAQSLRVKTSGDQITMSVYTDANQVTQLGSDIVYTATGAAVNPTYGLTIMPSSYNQSLTVDAANITRS
jgi:hypothetical protein